MTQTKAQSRYEREKAHNTERAMAEMVRLSNELHGDKIAPNSAEYEMFREDAPTREFVNRHYGNWENFAVVCGLTMREHAYYYAEARVRQEQWNAIDTEPRMSAARQRKEEQAATLAPMGLAVKDKPRREVWRSAGRVWEGIAWELR